MIGLNDKQREAVDSLEGPVLVIAGAGSGKTRVLTQRIAKLIDMGVNPYSILAITFTNKAANEMRSRVEDLVDFDISYMWISTFHSMCVRILRFDGVSIGYKSGFSIYDSDDSLRLVKKVLEDCLLKDEKEYNPRLIRSAISRYKNSCSLSSPDDFADDHYPIISYRFSEIFEKYQSRLKDQNAMDFDDLLLNTYRLFCQCPEVLEKYQNRFKYILVDEYQDTNDIQYRLVKMMSAVHGNVFVVGDDDQSIYAFRGANIKNILNFEKDFKNAKKISLEQNYRSDVNILNVANSIIRNNRSRNEKELWSEISGSSKPKVYYARNEYDEADYVAEKILKLSSEGVAFSEIAVFYRANYLSRLIEERLRGNGIPYNIFGGVSFYEKIEIKDILAYLTVIVNPDSDLSFLRSINTPKRGIGPVSIQKISDIASENHLSMYESCKIYCEQIKGSAQVKIREYIDTIEKYKNLLNEIPAHEIIEGIVNDIDYYDMLEESYYEDAENRHENIVEFINSAYQMGEEAESLPLQDFLQNISLITDMDSTDENGVSLMTIHMAKGLEFNSVFIIGMNEDIFPNQKALNDGEVEEERRLCYVAVTRAKRNLFMVGAKTRTVFGNTVNTPLSCFIDEIDEDLIDVMGAEKTYKTMDFDDSSKFSSLFTDKAFSIPKRSSEDKDISVFNVGVRVNHSKFGKGIINKISGTGEYTVAEISFDEHGIKKMFLSMAPLSIED